MAVRARRPARLLAVLLCRSLALHVDARDVWVARATLGNVTGLPAPPPGDVASCAAAARQSAFVEVALSQSAGDATLKVDVAVSGLDAAAGVRRRRRCVLVRCSRVRSDFHAEKCTRATDSGSAQEQFGANVAIVWDAVVDTVPGVLWTTSLKGVSLRNGEVSSCLGRSIVLTYCKSEKCAIVHAGTIGKGKTPDGDTNLAGPGPDTLLGDSTLVCLLQQSSALKSSNSHSFSGTMLISKDVKSTTVRMRATGSVFQPGSTHRLSLHTFGVVGSSDVSDELGTVFDARHTHDDGATNYHHNLPCSLQRRIGDLGNAVVQSSDQLSLKYDGRFVLFDDFAPLVGSACAAWAKPDVTCAEWASGCGDYRKNDMLLGIGIVGLANPGASIASSGSVGSGGSSANFDYDCSPDSASKRAVAHIWPIATRPASAPSVSGKAYFHSNGGAAGGITIDLNLVGLRDGSAAVTVQTLGMSIGAKDVFNPLGRAPGLPPATTRRAGDAECNDGARLRLFFISSRERCVAGRSERSILGRAVAIYANPAQSHGVGRGNAIVAWGSSAAAVTIRYLPGTQCPFVGRCV